MVFFHIVSLVHITQGAAVELVLLGEMALVAGHQEMEEMVRQAQSLGHLLLTQEEEVVDLGLTLGMEEHRDLEDLEVVVRE
jgi:hypothetical protein